MKEKFYQACYTRVGVHEGWKSINVSPMIPGAFLSFFEKTEKGNEVKRGTPLDVNGNALWMLEIMSDKNCVGIARTQYGLSDAFGRSNYFCHGYLFPNSYELLKDPGQLLCISDSNFKRNIEESQEIPGELVRNAPMSIQEALRSCNMTEKEYVTYIKCVYYALSTNTKNTIYVRTDGTDDMAKNLLYLVYMAVPYSLRTKITACTCPEIDGADKMLIFCSRIPEYAYFVDPRNGENNILTEAIKNRWKRTPFVSFFAENSMNPQKNEEIYQSMELWLAEMGDVTMNSMDALRLAYNMCSLDIREVDDEELHGILYDWLALPVPNSESLERYIVYVLRETISRRMKLSKDTENLLKERADMAETEKLKDMYFRYLSFAITQMDMQDGCDYLRDLGKENPLFIRLREVLKSTSEGIELLSEYYRKYTRNITSDPNCTYGDLIEAYFDCEDLSNIIEEIRFEIHKKNVDISLEALKSGIGWKQILQDYNETEADINSRKAMPEQFFDVYDRMIQEDFQIDKLNEYDEFYSHHKQYQFMRQYLRTIHAIKNRNYGFTEQFLQSKWIKNLNSSLTDKLFCCALENGAAEKCESIVFWESFARLKHVSVIDLMAKNKICILCQPESLKHSFESSPEYWQKEGAMEKFYYECQQLVENHPEYKDAISESCDVLKNRLNQKKAEEKRRQAEEKRRQKELSKKEKKEGGLKGLFGSFGRSEINYDDDDKKKEMPDEKKSRRRWKLPGHKR